MFSGNLNPFYRISKYRDLCLVLIWREFNIRYKQSVLGILWAIIQPLSMMLLFTLIFTVILPVNISKYPFPLFFYSGLVFWTFFSSSLNYSIPCLKNNYQLISKIYFPKEILPLSGIAVAFVDLLISFVILLAMMIFYHIPFTLSTLWVFPLILLLAIFTLSISLILSSLNVFYRDVGLATNFLIQLWFFATPVFYSIDKLSPNLKLILFLNPLTFIIENMRRCLMENRGVVPWQFLLLSIFVLIIFKFSYNFFISAEKRFADVI